MNDLSLDWLRRLRWLAVGGQGVTLLVASGWLQLPIQTAPLIAIFLVTALSNVLLGHLPERAKQSQYLLRAISVADIFLLTLMLQFSGGPENPFSILYLLHVVVAAVVLDRVWSWGIAILSIILFGMLFVVTDGKHGMHHHSTFGAAAEGIDPASGLSVHLLGMWVAYIIVALITVYCISRIAEELRKSERQAESLRANHQRLASLTTLAAGAAHELSTPLGTILIALEELERATIDDPFESRYRIHEDIELMKSELARCKEIVHQMGGCSGEVAGEQATVVSLGEFMNEIRESLHARFGTQVAVESGEEDPVLRIPRLAIRQAVTSLAKNAVESAGAETRVLIRADIENGNCRLQVADNGCGMPPEVLDRVGEPFFSTKEEGKGMGLGVFLARLTAESIGGKLQLHSEQGQGTTAEMVIPV